MKENLIGWLLRIIPKNHLSYLFGRLVHLRLPDPLRGWSLRWFAWQFHLNMSESEKELLDYESIGALFVRHLKPGARPMDSEPPLHPSDSVLTRYGLIKKGQMIQVKGKSFFIGDFLALSEEKEREMEALMEGGFYATYYLCPTDYHRVHSPITGQVESVTYVPGKLWPVNTWSVRSISNLFSINERVIVKMRSEQGIVYVVLVGATNVGQMTLSFDTRIRSNQLGSRQVITTHYPSGPMLRAGDELGVFHMGSTVIVIYQKDYIGQEQIKKTSSGRVQVKQSLFS